MFLYKVHYKYQHDQIEHLEKKKEEFHKKGHNVFISHKSRNKRKKSCFFPLKR